jgi:tRNA1(Val) A37 N6-methylase TrmN6
MPIATTTDTFLDGRMVLRQPVKGHRAGTDTMLLASFARAAGGLRVVDLGAGIGTAGLALAMMEPERNVVLVEREPELAALARENAMRHAPDRAIVAQADLTDAKALAAALGASGVSFGGFDTVMMNPPFLDSGAARLSPDAQRRGAHAMAGDGLAAWFKTARRLLRPGGALCLIHRADALALILAGLETGFGAARILPVQAREGEAAHRVLVRATLGSRAPLTLLAPLILHDAAGGFTPQVEAVHRELEGL